VAGPFSLNFSSTVQAGLLGVTSCNYIAVL
jgi:hypothetical protein